MNVLMTRHNCACQREGMPTPPLPPPRLRFARRERVDGGASLRQSPITHSNDYPSRTPPSARGHVMDTLFGSAFNSCTAAMLSSSDVVVLSSFAFTSCPKWTSLAPKKDSFYPLCPMRHSKSGASCAA